MYKVQLNTLVMVAESRLRLRFRLSGYKDKKLLKLKHALSEILQSPMLAKKSYVPRRISR